VFFLVFFSSLQRLLHVRFWEFKTDNKLTGLNKEPKWSYPSGLLMSCI
ncbi:unnamed protein product, partial [Brassica oleracea]